MISKLSQIVLVIAILISYLILGMYMVKKGLYLILFFKGFQFVRGVVLMGLGITFESGILLVVTSLLSYFSEQKK